MQSPGIHRGAEGQWRLLEEQTWHEECLTGGKAAAIPSSQSAQWDHSLFSTVIPPERCTEPVHWASSKPSVSSWVVVSYAGACVESLVPVVPLPPTPKHKPASSRSRMKELTMLLIGCARSLQPPGFLADVLRSFKNSWVGSCVLPVLLLCESLSQIFICFARVLNASSLWV